MRLLLESSAVWFLAPSQARRPCLFKLAYLHARIIDTKHVLVLKLINTGGFEEEDWGGREWGGETAFFPFQKSLLRSTALIFFEALSR
jgi:hypothetical protein